MLNPLPRRIRLTHFLVRLICILAFAVCCSQTGWSQDVRRIIEEENALREKYVAPVAVVGRVGFKNGEHPNGTQLHALTLTVDTDVLFFCTQTYSMARGEGNSQAVALAASWVRIPKGREISFSIRNQSKGPNLSLIGKRIMAIGYPLRGFTAWYILPEGFDAETVEVLPFR